MSEIIVIFAYIYVIFWVIFAFFVAFLCLGGAMNRIRKWVNQAFSWINKWIDKTFYWMVDLILGEYEP